MQLAFLTLFLGLVTGSLPLSLTAGPDVAKVEIVLDGAPVQRLAAPPWSGRIDFGAALLPHHLEARGLDAQGREVAHAEQWINVPRDPAEAQIVVEKAQPGQPRTIRLAWQSITSDAPTKVALTFDGAPLAFDSQYRAVLPALHGTDTHVVAAELQFAGGATARHAVALGGEYDDAVASDLTAVPVWIAPRAELPPLASLQGWFAEEGRPLQVQAADAAAPWLLTVRDAAAMKLLRLSWMARDRFRFKLPPGSRMRFIWPQAKRHEASGLPSEIFDSSTYAMDVARDSIPWLLTRVQQPGADHPRLADAAAASGLALAAAAGPRALIVVLDPDTKDYSHLDSATVRRYLEAIHIPLFVWAVGPPSADLTATWGHVTNISVESGMESAFAALRQVLDRQRIVWLAGHHLPQRIALTPAAAGLQLTPP